MVEKVLNQEQIDAMVRAARGGHAAAPIRRNVTPWDARQAAQIGGDQMRAISVLHEGFARNLTHSLGAYLRIVFEAALVSAEHLTYGEFLQRIPEVTYLASCKLEPMGVPVPLQLDLSVAYPLIDVLLGGQGAGALPDREITEIEEQILESVVRIICRELQTAWQALGVEFQFEQRQQPQQVQHLMPSEEKTLSLSFEITMAASRGTFNVVIPAVVSNALLRKLAAGYAASKPRRRMESDERLKARLLACGFEAELATEPAPVPLQRLAELAVGDLLVLPRRVDEAAVLSVAGREMFAAAAARRGSVRAARLLHRAKEKDMQRRPRS